MQETGLGTRQVHDHKDISRYATLLRARRTSGHSQPFSHFGVEPRIDWASLQFTPAVTDHVLFGNDVLKQSYRRRRTFLTDFMEPVNRRMVGRLTFKLQLPSNWRRIHTVISVTELEPIPRSVDQFKRKRKPTEKAVLQREPTPDSRQTPCPPPTTRGSKSFAN